MPDMDEGAFVLDYNMPVGTSLAQTDKVMRRVEAVLAADARHLRLHPPDRGRARLLRHRVVHRRHPGEPEAGRRAPADGRDLRRAPRGARRPRSPSWRPSSSRWCRTRSTTWRASTARSRSRSSAPTSAKLRELAEQVGKIVEKVEGVADVNAHVLLGNPDIVIRPDSVQTARVGLTELDVESSAQRRALRPGGQHGPRAGPDDQDPRPLSRPGAVRPRAPGPVADQPGDRDAATASTRHGDGRDRLRPARSTRDDPQSSAARTSCGARTSSRSSRSPPSSTTATWARSTANCKRSSRS